MKHIYPIIPSVEDENNLSPSLRFTHLRNQFDNPTEQYLDKLFDFYTKK